MIYGHEDHHEATPAEGNAPLWAWCAFWLSFIVILGLCV